MKFKNKKHVLPGFHFSLFYTLGYLGLIILLPLAALTLKTSTMSWADFWTAVTNPRVMASYKISFGLSFLSACINTILGGIIAWTLVRYHFPGRRLIDAMIDLPFALPTAVAGLALTALYSPTGWIGGPLYHLLGIKVAYTPLGILVAMLFIGFPFVVRAIQPVIEDLNLEYEEAAACLGASRWTSFNKIILPVLLPGLMMGGTLAFGRAVGEFGSVIFIAGNLPFKTEITPLLITTKLEQFDYNGAAAIGLVMLAVSFLILMAMNVFQAWNSKLSGLEH
jgi:sulfate transport system permease protein